MLPGGSSKCRVPLYCHSAIAPIYISIDLPSLISLLYHHQLDLTTWGKARPVQVCEVCSMADNSTGGEVCQIMETSDAKPY